MSADRRIPDLILEQYRLNELPAADVARVERLLREDDSLRQRLAALDASDREIAGRHPPEWLAGRVRERLQSQNRQSRTAPAVRRFAAASALAAAAVVMAFAIPWEEGDRLKGLSPSLAIYRRTAQGSETLADGAAARSGDLLRLGYVSAGRGYGVILSIDGRGVVTLHLPPEGARAVTLRGGGTVLLDQAYELDDAPAWERFYFVTSEHAFDVAPVLEAARRAASQNLRAPPATLPISRELEQATFSLQKEVRP